jgi:hypothetical protein
MATKAQLIEFILDKFTETDGNAVSKSKLENLRKAELEEFIAAHNMQSELESWLTSK